MFTILGQAQTDLAEDASGLDTNDKKKLRNNGTATIVLRFA